MSTPLPDDPVSTAIEAPDAPAFPPCPPPADIRAEVSRYDRAATVGVWPGPRYRMTYRVLGEGPPLIWVPGIASTYRTYAQVLNRLSERFRTILYDYPGEHPGDEARLGRIGHNDLVDDVFGLIEHLRIGRVFLVGLSFGSTVVLSALHREPRRFPRAVVQGAFAHRPFTIAERLALSLGSKFPGSVSGLPMREMVLAYNNKMDFPALLEDRWSFYLEQNGLTPIRSLAHRSRLVGGLDLRPLLPEIPTEILLVQGHEDRVVPRRFHEELKASLPRSESAIMPTVGHVPHLTHSEAFAHLIKEWLLPCAPAECNREHHEDTEGCQGPWRKHDH